MSQESAAAPVPLCSGAAASGFDELAPWRVFRSRRGQTHYSGRYWSTVMSDHVGYESRLELAWLLLNDRDRRWRRIVSQPFQLVNAALATPGPGPCGRPWTDAWWLAAGGPRLSRWGGCRC
jgi:hypothetical protein